MVRAKFSDAVYENEEAFKKAANALLVPFMKKTGFYTSNDLTVHRKLRAEAGNSAFRLVCCTLAEFKASQAINGLHGNFWTPKKVKKRGVRGNGYEGGLCAPQCGF